METHEKETEPKQQEHAVPSHQDAWAEAKYLPCELRVALPVSGFTVGDLLSLGLNSIIDTARNQALPLPLWVNGVMVAWADLDASSARMAARVTELV